MKSGEEIDQKNSSHGTRAARKFRHRRRAHPLPRLKRRNPVAHTPCGWQCRPKRTSMRTKSDLTKPFEPVDAVELTAKLIRCPSVTPAEAGQSRAAGGSVDAGFTCSRVDRGGLPTYMPAGASRGRTSLSFNGHTDVVPVGDASAWRFDRSEPR